MKKFLSLAIIVVAIGTILTQTSCRENIVLKSNLAPNINNIALDTAGDSLTLLYTKTVYDKDTSYPTSNSYNNLYTYHGIGNISSSADVFGSTNASAYIQIVPSSYGPYTTINTTNDIIDSAVLVVPYGNGSITWGDTTNFSATQKYIVYRITDTLSTLTSYYPYQTKPVDLFNPLSDTTVVNIHTLEDSVTVDTAYTHTTAQVPHLRIKLNNTFINDVLNLNNSASPADFLAQFNGLYITTVDNNGRAIPYFRIDGDPSTVYGCTQVLLYYHTTSSSTEQIFPFTYTSSYCAHFNNITRVYSSYVNNLLSSPALSDSVVLLQNEAGLAIDITIPRVQYLPKTIINSAQLIITQVGTGNKDDQFYPPPAIYVTGVAKKQDNTDSIYTIRDAQPTNSYTLAFIDGTAKILPGTSTTQYILNIPREVQNAILTQRPLHLRINGTQDYPGTYRLKAGGAGLVGTTNMKIKFRVVYSKLK